jgi:hypothetical protein
VRKDGVADTTFSNRYRRCLKKAGVLYRKPEKTRHMGAALSLPATEAVPADTEISLDDSSAAIRGQAAKMATVYQAFFCFENSAREFVGQRRLENHGDDWWERGTTAAIRKKVGDRQRKEAANRSTRHEARARSPMPTSVTCRS